MARARNIKPSFFINEELVECDFSTRLLFIGLWTLADRDGKLEDKPKKIKISLFPADNIDIDEMLNCLQNHGFILRYEVNENYYIQILAFKKHQNPHRDERASIIPNCYLNDASTVQTPCNNNTSIVPIGLIPDTYNLIPDVGAEKSSAPKKVGKSLPGNWVLPKKWGEWALSERPDFTADEVRNISESFKDHWLSTANQAKSRRADWEATWRNWVRRQEKAKSIHKNKSQVITDGEFDKWLNSTEKKAVSINE